MLQRLKFYFSEKFRYFINKLKGYLNKILRNFKYLILQIKLLILRIDRHSEYRIYTIIAIIFILFVILQIALFVVCIAGDSVNKITHKKYLNLNDERIEIYDRNGVLLAKDVASYDLYLRPYQILNVPEEIRKIGKIIGKIKYKEGKIIENAMLKQKDKNARILIQMGISEIDRKTLLENGVIGIEFDIKKTRYYLTENLFCHIIGVTSDDGEGISGIEKSISQNRVPFEDKVVLSVDSRIQSVLHDSLSQVVKEYNAQGAFGVFIDINTGEILAGVSLPDYNPNDKSTMTFDTAFNKFSLGTYEFGSIFKIINHTLAVENEIPMNKVYDISEDLVVDGKSISEMQRKRNTMTTEEVLMYSSNIGSGKILLEIGAEKQRELFERLGLTSRIKLELPEVGNVMIPSKRDWRGIRAVTMAYGHGIAVTQLNYIRALATILNGGKLINLTLVKRNELNPLYFEDVIDEKVSEKMRELVRKVVLYGAGRAAKSEFYDIGGKSGTAIKLKATGGYDKKKNLISFTVAFPMKEPKYAMIISLDEPQWSDAQRMELTGSTVLGRVAKEIVHSSAFFLGIEKVKPQINKTEIDAIIEDN